jgi:outer membrane immunogenic protein
MKSGLQVYKRNFLLKTLLMISIVCGLFIIKPAQAIDNVNWTGFHVAGGVGYGMLIQNAYVTETSVPITAKETAGARGWLGRVGAGYNYQLPNCFVVGAFGDYDVMELSGQQDFPGAVGRERQTGAWYVGGLMGYKFTPLTLAFIDAGYTGTRLSKVDYLIAISGGGPAGFALKHQTYDGWFLGLGMETLLVALKSSELLLRTEYRYSKYGTENIPIIGVPFVVGDVGLRSRIAGQTVITSLNWAI